MLFYSLTAHICPGYTMDIIVIDSNEWVCLLIFYMFYLFFVRYLIFPDFFLVNWVFLIFFHFDYQLYFIFSLLILAVVFTICTLNLKVYPHVIYIFMYKAIILKEWTISTFFSLCHYCHTFYSYMCYKSKIPSYYFCCKQLSLSIAFWCTASDEKSKHSVFLSMECIFPLSCF